MSNSTPAKPKPSPLRDPNQAWARVFILISVFLIILFIMLLHILSPTPPRERWIADLRLHQSSVSQTDGTEALVKLLRAVDWKAAERYQLELREVAGLGVAPSEELLRFLGKQGEVVRAAGLLSGAGSLDLPTLEGKTEPAPRPHLEDMKLLGGVLGANAASILHYGRAEEAAQRAAELFMVGALLCQSRSTATLGHHLAGYFLMEAALPVLEAIAETSPTIVTSESVSGHLRRATMTRQFIAEGIIAELQLAVRTIEAGSARPERLADVLQFYNEEIGRADALAEAFVMLHHAVTVRNDLRLLLPELEQRLAIPVNDPLPSREELLELITNPLLVKSLPDPAGALRRERQLLTRINGLSSLVHDDLETHSSVVR